MALTSRPRAVVLRALGLGDLLAAVPALRGLRRALPDHETVLLCPPDIGALLHDAGVVDTVVAHTGLSPLPRHVHGADVAVDLHGSGPQSHVLLQAIHPRRLVGYACTAAGVEGPTWDRAEHERARWCRLVDETWGTACDPDDTALDVDLPAPPVGGAVVLHPGAAAGARRWPPDRWAEVAAAVARQAPVVLTGTAEERGLCVRVADEAGLTEKAVLAGETDVAGVASLVRSARLVLCSDTGVAHLAPAFGTPSVTLFGPTPPARWGPPPRDVHRVLWGRGRPGLSEEGDPHGESVDDGLLAIEPVEVLAAAAEALAAGMAPGPVGIGAS
ncbi:glycosyltransferase family 9 protein [Mumia zhuanghuii]|uniref:Glycosyltransferase family 9 protein n=1 Tax=Mumia zhuanghuii TaxID=2585211 RepID=A0A5C4MDU4_9ACTN|nr:glycosyltransferase family 9 protein [Mumia zhuanghuii]TNC36596.1 glycosyltransferase family 9 protein [Mumia zhuanghuii]TNC46351.1 glycosyltransferase family 9 protein [Mumia zhuanghuii]